MNQIRNLFQGIKPNYCLWLLFGIMWILCSTYVSSTTSLFSYFYEKITKLVLVPKEWYPLLPTNHFLFPSSEAHSFHFSQRTSNMCTELVVAVAQQEEGKTTGSHSNMCHAATEETSGRKETTVLMEENNPRPSSSSFMRNHRKLQVATKNNTKKFSFLTWIAIAYSAVLLMVAVEGAWDNHHNYRGGHHDGWVVSSTNKNTVCTIKIHHDTFYNVIGWAFAGGTVMFMAWGIHFVLYHG
jgi:hypothetical protein